MHVIPVDREEVGPVVVPLGHFAGDTAAFLILKIEDITITVDLSKEFGPSSSGKTIIVASTEGNVTVPDREEKIGLNVYRKK